MPSRSTAESEAKRINTRRKNGWFKDIEQKRKKTSESLMGHKQFNTGKTHFKKGDPSPNKGKKRPNISGEKNGFWKGGVTPEIIKLRTSTENDNWRNEVFIRDNYTCQKTGIRGGKLVVHHILNFSSYPDLRFDINNGITLSEKSHIDFHNKYGRINNTRKQLEEFLSNKKK